MAPRSVRCINPNLQLAFQTGEIKKRDRPRFQTARFPEFWQSAIPANEGKKNAKTLGSCKPNAHWCANLKARARDRPHKFFTSLHYLKTNKNFQVFHDTSKKQDQVPDQSDCPNHFV